MKKDAEVWFEPVTPESLAERPNGISHGGSRS